MLNSGDMLLLLSGQGQLVETLPPVLERALQKACREAKCLGDPLMQASTALELSSAEARTSTAGWRSVTCHARHCGQGIFPSVSHGSMAWRERALIKDYFWKQMLLHDGPRACGEWLDLASKCFLLLLLFSPPLVSVCCSCCVQKVS